MLDAASVIIAAKSVFPKTCVTKNANNVNFKVLTLKRSSQSSFMPDSYVFPGGNVDTADSSKAWLDLFGQFGVQNSLFESLAPVRKEPNKINIFDRSDDQILKSISLRISGIRETFEESGILLCKSGQNSNSKSKWASFLSGHEIQEWQQKVQDNASEFINLCKHFKCYPDIWSLQTWSNWLSPPDFPKRFNSIFFVASINQMPPTFCIGGEINEIKWELPQELIESCNRQKVQLPPPQYYELSRLMNFSEIEQLADYAEQRNSAPCDLWMSYRIKALDGVVFLFPGKYSD
ncbi:Nucleoside diphosphate-linked moiety X motif 19 [Blattella germanica]|nr:Nucleoside diphosphate-linked moiety X motif 19 [Blattella germanica]